jgi:hypothetical protein
MVSLRAALQSLAKIAAQPFDSLGGMRCRMKDARPGQILPVEDDYHYPLPVGLRSGDVVRLVAFDHGYWTVEKDGQQFRVFMCCVQSGFEYEIGGRWVPADDWRVKALCPRA